MNIEICEHGSIRRKCVICEAVEDDAEIGRLRAELAERDAEIVAIHERLESGSYWAFLKEQIATERQHLAERDAEIERLKEDISDAIAVGVEIIHERDEARQRARLPDAFIEEIRALHGGILTVDLHPWMTRMERLTGNLLAWHDGTKP